ncbi:hypothetical protein CTI14_12295 [Methylobacterium radiotolerans]|nr:hypothetical protein CTI14_12295 [Methylobacterium radiotolerans]
MRHQLAGVEQAVPGPAAAHRPHQLCPELPGRALRPEDVPALPPRPNSGRGWPTVTCIRLTRLSGYTLLKLENHHHKERISLGRLTIEHILPQTENLHPDWLAMLGAHAAEVQGRYLHTLGNLTLTGYNSELSARPFQEKRDLIPGGFKDSHLRLNADLAQLDVRNEEQIKRRAEKLADQALQVWPMLQPSAEAVARVDDRTNARPLSALWRTTSRGSAPSCANCSKPSRRSVTLSRGASRTATSG